MDAPIPSFPQDLAAVPEGERIVEAFGWAPLCWAGLLLLVPLVLLSPPGQRGAADAALAAGALALALLLVGYDYRRRQRPKVVVRLGYGPLIGIYQFGQLKRTVELARSQILIKHPSRTWGPLFMLAMTTLACLSFLLPSPFQISLGDRLLALFAATCTASLAASVVKTRLRCEEGLFPYPSTPGFEHILVPRQAIARIFSRPG
jgi:hypothetical protein